MLARQEAKDSLSEAFDHRFDPVACGASERGIPHLPEEFRMVMPALEFSSERRGFARHALSVFAGNQV